MVTIEQKLTLFSSLLQRSIDESFKEEIDKLRKEYADRSVKGKETADKEAEKIINNARKKAETERIEMISRARVLMKKEYMNVKEKCFSVFMERVREEIGKFVMSDNYPAYMVLLLKKLKSYGQLPRRLIIYMTDRDSERFTDIVKQELQEQGQIELIFKAAGSIMLGGFIAEDPEGRIRLDLSLASMLEDNESYIMQTLFQAIETGDINDIE